MRALTGVQLGARKGSVTTEVTLEMSSSPRYSTCRLVSHVSGSPDGAQGHYGGGGGRANQLMRNNRGKTLALSLPWICAAFRAQVLGL